MNSTKSYSSIKKRQNDNYVFIPDEMMKSYVRFGNYIVMMAIVFGAIYGFNWVASILWRVFVGGLRN